VKDNRRVAGGQFEGYAYLMRIALAAAGLVAFALAAGCSPTRIQLRADAPDPKPLPSDLAARFEYERETLEPALERVEDTPVYEKLRGRYQTTCPVKGEPCTVTFEFWRTKKGEGRRPVVTIVPILAGRYVECDALGQLMAENGMHAFFVWREDNLIPLGAKATGGDPFETKLRRAIVNIRRTLDWVVARPDVAPDRVGLVGISLGAIAGTIVMAVEPRIQRGVLIMGGGDLPGIMCDSIETPVRRYKLKRMRENGWTEAEFKEAVRRELPSDPLDFAPYVGPRRVQQFISKYDNKVPTVYQWKLWEALGRPEAWLVPIGHYTAIFYLGFAKDHAMAFMREGLLEPKTADAALPPKAASPVAPASSSLTGR
jgi:hypothetical protein